MPTFDSLERASFGDIAFAVKTVRVMGKYEHHTHRYLRVPGGVNEKFERNLYTIQMEAHFDTNIKSFGPDYWPGALRRLRTHYENGDTLPLVIPTIGGAIPAFMPEWDQSADLSKNRSGEVVQLHFLEDQHERFLTQAVAKTTQNSVEAASKKLKLTQTDFAVAPGSQDIFDKIQEASNAVFGVRDRAQMYGGMLAARVGVLTTIIQEADRSVEELKNPRNSELSEALMELWEASLDLAREVSFSPQGAQIYVTPRLMSVSQISIAIYKNTEAAVELMQNNSFADPFAVPAQTDVIYFPRGVFQDGNTTQGRTSIAN